MEVVAAELDGVEEADERRREVGQFNLLLASMCDGEVRVVARNVPRRTVWLHGGARSASTTRKRSL